MPVDVTQRLKKEAEVSLTSVLLPALAGSALMGFLGDEENRLRNILLGAAIGGGGSYLLQQLWPMIFEGEPKVEVKGEPGVIEWLSKKLQQEDVQQSAGKAGKAVSYSLPVFGGVGGLYGGKALGRYVNEPIPSATLEELLAARIPGLQDAINQRNLYPQPALDAAARENTLRKQIEALRGKQVTVPRTKTVNPFDAAVETLMQIQPPPTQFNIGDWHKLQQALAGAGLDLPQNASGFYKDLVSKLRDKEELRKFLTQNLTSKVQQLAIGQEPVEVTIPEADLQALKKEYIDRVVNQSFARKYGIPTASALAGAVVAPRLADLLWQFLD